MRPFLLVNLVLALLVTPFSKLYPSETNFSDFRVYQPGFQNPWGLDLFLGPEVYYLRRTREGGGRQEGALGGVRAGFDRFYPYSWYLGGELLYAGGSISGHNRNDLPIKSDLRDFIIDARVGYSFVQSHLHTSFFTPFVGYGYFSETNTFKDPSPLLVKYIDTMNFIAAGFLSGVNFTPLLSMGLDLKLRFMIKGHSKITDDPIFDDQTLIMNNAIQVRAEVPFTYRFSCWERPFALDFVPFFEYRHFGGRQDFPFDFIDTKFELVGARLDLRASF